MQQQFFGERNHENTVRRSHAHAHNGAHQGRDAERCVREEQETNDAGKGSRKCGDDDEGIQPRLKVHHDQEIDENDGENESAQQSDV